MTEDQKIVEFIGKVSEDKWDELEINYIKKYYPIKESDIKESAGWISPDGKFYSCNSWGHRSLARKLSAHYYNDLENPEYKLENTGWLKLYDTGVIAYKDIRKPLDEVITNKQRKTIYKLMSLQNTSETWSLYIKNILNE